MKVVKFHRWSEYYSREWYMFHVTKSLKYKINSMNVTLCYKTENASTDNGIAISCEFFTILRAFLRDFRDFTAGYKI